MHEEIDNPTPREKLEQAALLPENDPVRARLLEEADAAIRTSNHHPNNPQGGLAGREWSELLEETERLKSALSSVPVPAGLEDRLLAIPDRQPAKAVPWWNRPAGELLTTRRLAVAAGFLLIVAAGWLAYLGIASWRQQRTMESVAAAAVDLHKTLATQPPAEHIVTSDPRQAQEWLQPRINFPAIILRAPGMKLTGAGVVRLRDATVALTRWEKDGHAYTLLEFAPTSLGLPTDFAQRTTEDPTPGPAGEPTKIVMWAEPQQGCGWVLVMDKSAENKFTY